VLPIRRVSHHPKSKKIRNVVLLAPEEGMNDSPLVPVPIAVTIEATTPSRACHIATRYAKRLNHGF